VVFPAQQVPFCKKLGVVLLLDIDKGHNAGEWHRAWPQRIKWAKIEVELVKMAHDFGLIIEQHSSIFPPFIFKMIQLLTIMVIVEEDVIILLVRP
jgi:hypothetical protein